MEIKKIKKYEKSKMYQIILRTIEEGNIDQAFIYLMPFSADKKKSTAVSLIEILKEAYNQGDKSDEFLETLKGALRMYYQEMCNEGLIHNVNLENVE